MVDHAIKSTTPRVVVVIPNLNGTQYLERAITSVLAQRLSDLTLLIVDNGSTDDSRHIIETYQQKDVRVQAIWHPKNYGYTGGVNAGFRQAIAGGYHFVVPFNNDAYANEYWLQYLVDFMETHPGYGAAACKQLHTDGKTIDSAGEQFTVWGLSYSLGRGEKDSSIYNQRRDVFGATGGASLYRVATLAHVGLLDEDFFAYSEDIDLSFRIQLAGWKIAYVPRAVIYHKPGSTSKRMASDFYTYQALKNYPWVVWKNVPWQLFLKIFPRFSVAYLVFIAAALQRGQFRAVCRGVGTNLMLLPKKLWERRCIQKNRKASNDYIANLLTYDLPPTAHKLRTLRRGLRKLTFRKAI